MYYLKKKNFFFLLCAHFGQELLAKLCQLEVFGYLGVEIGLVCLSRELAPGQLGSEGGYFLLKRTAYTCDLCVCTKLNRKIKISKTQNDIFFSSFRRRTH